MKNDILHTLRYFSLFDHPLTQNEIFQFLNVKSTYAELEMCLDELVKTGEIAIFQDLYHLASSSDFTNSRRTKEMRARKMICSARIYASIIARFPFVRSVCISGSVSKLAASPNADLDFFIVTAANRLWIARTLLHLFKKLTFLTGHQHCFCMNYFVDEDHLQLPFENVYTAIELRTLIPVYGTAVWQRLIDANRWTSNYLPNHDGCPLATIEEIKTRINIKSYYELFFNHLSPAYLNLYLMQITDWKWRRKYRDLALEEDDYDRALMTRPYLSKNHPRDFQCRIMRALDDSLEIPALKRAVA